MTILVIINFKIINIFDLRSINIKDISFIILNEIIQKFILIINCPICHIQDSSQWSCKVILNPSSTINSTNSKLSFPFERELKHNKSRRKAGIRTFRAYHDDLHSVLWATNLLTKDFVQNRTRSKFVKDPVGPNQVYISTLLTHERNHVTQEYL